MFRNPNINTNNSFFLFTQRIRLWVEDGARNMALSFTTVSVRIRCNKRIKTASEEYYPIYTDKFDILEREVNIQMEAKDKYLISITPKIYN